MSCGPHDHGGDRGDDTPHAAHEHGPDRRDDGGTAFHARSAWSSALRSPTMWLLAALALVAASFALKGDPSGFWGALPYFAIGWMLLHHLGGHGGHARHGGRRL